MDILSLYFFLFWDFEDDDFLFCLEGNGKDSFVEGGIRLRH